jgi:hypothetical protein
MVVFANKVDMEDERQVTKKEAQDWCSKQGIKLYETSAKEGMSFPRSCYAWHCLMYTRFTKSTQIIRQPSPPNHMLLFRIIIVLSLFVVFFFDGAIIV